MIAYLKGTVTEVDKDSIILECRNIGYRIFMPGSVLERMGRTGEERIIHTYLNIREDAMQLYGFLTKNDLSVFRLLLGVSGIGPKAAMGILSYFSWEDLSFAVLSDDAAAIAKAPGIGKKTAQKVILELKDKLRLEDAFEQKFSEGGASDQPTGEPEAAQEAVEALVALGYGRTEALKAVRQVSAGGDMDVEDLLRALLDRWIRFLIPYDAAVFSRLSVTEDGALRFIDVEGYGLSPQALKVWKEQTQQDDVFRWTIYSTSRSTFTEDIRSSGSRLGDSKIYHAFWSPNGLICSAGLRIAFREEPLGFLRLYRRDPAPAFSERDLFVLDQLHLHLSYRLAYEAKKGDSHYFYAKGFRDKLRRQYGLTVREGEMLDLAIQGCSNDDIAKRLNISIHTVKKHFQSVYAKMHVRNRVQMMRCLPISTDKIDFDEWQ